MIKKRVLSICYIAPNKLGSFEEFIIALSIKLKEKGFSHVVVFEEEPIEEVYNQLLDAGAGIEIIKPTYSYLRDARLFYKLTKKFNPSVVHFHFYQSYTIFNYLALFKNIKIIYTEHMGYREPKNWFRGILREVYYPARAKIFGFGISKIICVSEFVKTKDLRRYKVGSQKFRVIYNGINYNKFKKIDVKNNEIITKFNIKFADIIITSVAYLGKEKGIQYLIRAAPLIIESVPHVKFIIVGDGPYRKNLETLIEEYDLKNYFFFTGRVVQKIENFYAISSCLVVPSIVKEGHPFVALEAMSSEVPVVAFSSGGLKEVVDDGETGYLVPAKDHFLLAEKIIEIVKNKDTGNIMGKKGRKRIIETFSLDICVNQYLKFYEENLDT